MSAMDKAQGFMDVEAEFFFAITTSGVKIEPLTCKVLKEVIY